MRIRANTLSVMAAILAVIGALNWGSIAFLNLNPVQALSRGSRLVERVIYGIVGIAGLWLGVGLAIPAFLTKVSRKEDGATILPGKKSIVGQEFPHLEGDNLLGRHVRLPEDIRGKVALLATGFAYESRWDVEDWVDAFRHRFESRPGFTYFEIPIIGGLPRLGAPIINMGMRRGTPSNLHSQVITIYEPSEPIRDRLRATHSANTWIYLVDADGTVLAQIGGAFDEEQFEKLAARASAAEAALRPRVGRRAA